jgi:hypothetical protein
MGTLWALKTISGCSGTGKSRESFFNLFDDGLQIRGMPIETVDAYVQGCRSWNRRRHSFRLLPVVVEEYCGYSGQENHLVAGASSAICAMASRVKGCQ